MARQPSFGVETWSFGTEDSNFDILQVREVLDSAIKMRYAVVPRRNDTDLNSSML